MEDKSVKESRIKPIYSYLKESIKFYDIDQPLVAQIIFVLQLAVVFGGYILAMPYAEKIFFYYEQIFNKFQAQIEAKNYDLSIFNSDIAINMAYASLIMLSIYFGAKAIAYLFGVVYGSYYYMSITNTESSLNQRFTVILKRFPKIIIFNILFYGVFAFFLFLITLTLGIASLIVPLFMMILPLLPFSVLAFDALFAFKNLLIVEFDVGVFRNFKKSLDITKGCKRKVILNGLWPVCLGLLLSTFSLGLENQLLSLFILAFFEIIIQLITQRLTVLMFIDAASVERIDGKVNEDKNMG